MMREIHLEYVLVWHRLFLAAGLLIEAGLVDTKTGELCYKKDRILQALKELKYDLETSPNPDA